MKAPSPQDLKLAGGGKCGSCGAGDLPPFDHPGQKTVLLYRIIGHEYFGRICKNCAYERIYELQEEERIYELKEVDKI